MIGAGFWSRFQLAAWKELPDVAVVAIANRSGDRARAVAEAIGVPAWYADPAEMLAGEEIDVVDVITAPDAHVAAVRLVADQGIPVICQKPLAPDLADARAAAAYCDARGVPLFVHESSRWQAPTRELARQIRAGRIGRPFRARLEFSTGFPVFDNQPFLRDAPRFILSDVGVHVLDVARFLFGEATSVSTITGRVHPDIKGEDVATVLLRMGDGITVTCEMSFATVLADDPFPETLIRVEGDEGTIHVTAGYRVRCTRADGTMETMATPTPYPWVDPAYAVIQSSMVACIADLLAGVRGEHAAETTAADNLRTLALVEAAYQSAESGLTVVP